MIFGKEPPYPHYAHLPYACEPWKSLYVFQRLVTTLLLVPFWALYYAVLPRSRRPRPSWSIKQIINVKFTRRIYKVTEVAGVTWGTRDPQTAPPEGSLKETRFEWVNPLPAELRLGVLVDERVPCKRVGVYVWPKTSPKSNPPASAQSSPKESSLLVKAAIDAKDPSNIVGMFMHGGGYCHMSAHESSRTSRIPRRLFTSEIFSEVYSVEYRLLQFGPFPAQLQDAAAVYAHILARYGTTRKIVLVGDSSGGNLVLALARWIRDEAKLRMPDGLLLLSPSTDISSALPETLSSYIPRPHADTDYLVDTPEPRALLQRAFLGFHYHPLRVQGLSADEREVEEDRRLMEIVHSEYVSPASPRVLKRWGHPIEQDIEVAHAEFTENNNIDAEQGLDELPSDSAFRKTMRFRGLFSGFPRTFVLVGDAERLEKEVKSLVGAMERDKVDITTVWLKDAVHDILMMAEGWWDESVREEAWASIAKWANGFQ